MTVQDPSNLDLVTSASAPLAPALDRNEFADEIARMLQRLPGAVIRKAQRRASLSPLAEVMAAVPTGGWHLDVHCGPGVLIGLLARDKSLAGAIGLDPDAIEIAAAESLKATCQLSPNFRFSDLGGLNSLRETPVESASLVGVLRTLDEDDRRPLVERVCRCLKLDGVLIVADHAQGELPTTLANAAVDVALHGRTFAPASVDQVADWITAQGFTQISAQVCRIGLAADWVHVYRRTGNRARARLRELDGLG